MRDPAYNRDTLAIRETLPTAHSISAKHSLRKRPRRPTARPFRISRVNPRQVAMSREHPDTTWTRRQTIARTNDLAVLLGVVANVSRKLAITWYSIETVNH